MITGFHNETSEPEVIQLLGESITEIGMTMENEERNTFVRSAKQEVEAKSN